MSSEGFKFQASVKDNDGDMVNVRADSAEELESNLLNFPSAAYAQFKSNVRGGAALGGLVQPSQAASQPAQAPQASGGWGGPPQQQSAPQQQAPQQSNGGGGGWQSNVQLHPEGLACHCGEVLQFGKTRTNKGQWKCPGYRWNNGNPNDHRLEWAN
jgi:hypothetical protein